VDQSVLWFTGDHCEQAEAIVMGTKNDIGTSKRYHGKRARPQTLLWRASTA
jgi:hypothetical protein